MIQVKIADCDDYVRWDDYVRSKSEATPYHLSAWNLAIKGAYGHKTYNLIAEDQGNICGVLPLCFIKPPILKGELCSLPFCDIGGVLADSALSKRLLEKALELSRSLGANTLAIRERTANDAISRSPTTGDRVGEKVSMLLKLPDSSEALFTGFKAKLRSQIRKSEKNGIIFSYGRDSNHLKAFYSVFSRNMKRLGSPIHSYGWFEQIRLHYGNNMLVGLVNKDDRVVGAGILLFLGNKVVVPWASTLVEYNRLAPNMLLYWNLLKFACDSGCRIFDFGRSTFGEGTYRFKAQWGAKPVLLVWRTYHSSGDLMGSESGSKSRVRPVMENVWSMLPLGFANFIGPLVRKYISL